MKRRIAKRKHARSHRGDLPIGSNVLIYVRVSDDSQVGGTSLDDQEQRCRRYCTDRGWNIVHVYREEGVSAKSTNRPKFLQAISYATKATNNVQAFVVYKIDRFARNTEDHVRVRVTLNNSGVRLLSVSEEISDDPQGRLLEHMLAGIAEFDNEIRSERSKNGMRQLIKRGIWPWRSFLGYESVGAHRKGEKKTTPDTPHPLLFPVIRDALKAYAAGGMGQVDMMEMLNAHGFERITGKQATIQIVDRILNETLYFYAGFVRDPWHEEDHGEEYIRGRHQPMITVEEMEAIERSKCGVRHGVHHDRNNPSFPLRRLIRCAECRNMLTGSSPKGRNGYYAYYHCYHKGCPLRNKAIRKDAVEDQFQKLLEAVTPSEECLTYLNRAITSRFNARVSELMTHEQTLVQTRNALEQRRKRLYELAETGTYSTEQFTERMKQVDADYTLAQLELEQVRAQTSVSPAMSIPEVHKAMHVVSSQWLKLPPHLRKRFQNLIFPAGICYDRKTGFGTVELALIFRLSQDYQSKNLEKTESVTLPGFEPGLPP